MTDCPRLLFIRMPVIVLLLIIIGPGCVEAQDTESEGAPPALNESPMTAERLGELILAVDHEAEFDETAWAFHVEGLEVYVIYDVAADRMRIIIPIGPATDIPAEELMRLMQANFDSALDARYAIARDTLWGAFVHPLSELSDDEFLMALGETANIVLTYGTSYSSGLLIYGGGDSSEIQRRELIDELRRKRT